MRILPHLQDTGGFFVAVFEKTDWLPWQLEAISRKQPSTTTDTQCDDGGTEGTGTVTDKVSQLPKRPDEILGKYVQCYNNSVVVCFMITDLDILRRDKVSRKILLYI